ncbi:MAG: FAD-dependent oxidoreductase [Balneolaceae bacterium]|nr:FAD-dependent oxidoreductase [Balneolaceae bacterium]
MKNQTENFDVIVAGAGMGGMTAASLIANAGYKVLVLEKAHVTGGCSSSYYRKGYIFESGATTLIGFDENQPLRNLEDTLGITLPKEPISPSMSVQMGDKTVTRWQDKNKWLNEVKIQFGEPAEQEAFWNLAFEISDVVWRVSGKNNFFPPVDGSDWFQLLKNNPMDVWVLLYALKSVKKAASDIGISNPEFYRFLDEQLIISSQADAESTPFLFGAPAITYTNYTNYYVPGGLHEMVKTLELFLKNHGAEVHTKEGVKSIYQVDGGYEVISSKGRRYRAKAVVSNIPVWNMPDYTGGNIASYFKNEAAKYDEAWGAFTMGIVTDDVYGENMTLHHQLHIEESEKTAGLDSDSIFVSMSKKGDTSRAETGSRVLNVSTHTKPEYWFELNGNYDALKLQVQNKITEILRKKLPGFNKAEIKLSFSATPVSWSNWVYRKKGRVGGIPQSMSRSLLDWTPNKTPFNGLYLCGDTVFPGQGIPGVTLSGFNVYFRVQKYLKNLSNH